MKVKIDEIKEKIEKYDFSFCIWTDRTDFLLNKNLPDEDKLLEIRCFDDDGEFHAVRSTINIDKFDAREINNDGFYDGFFDEEHFLDIDSAKTKKSNDGWIYATGGGRYNLPVQSAQKLVVRYYYKFDDNGIARKCDWRLMRFRKEEKNNG